MLRILLFLTLTLYTLHAKTFTVSYDPDYAPYSYTLNGKPYGLFIDIWKHFAKVNNDSVTFIRAESWDDAVNMAKTQKVDYFLGTSPYEKWMHSSYPFYQTKTSFFTRKTFTGTILSVGIIGTDYQADLKAYDSSLQLHNYPDYAALVDALLHKEIDAIYDDTAPLAYYTIDHHYQHLIKREALLVKNSDVDAISASAEKIRYFNHHFQKISKNDLIEIEKRWIYDQSERYYGKSQPLTTINYVYDPDWRPFEWKDEMRHAHLGIIADILSLISQKADITFKAIPTKSWNDSVRLVKSGKAEMFSAVPYTPERATYLNFTKHNIYSYPAVLVSHKENGFTLETNFRKKRIGIVKGNSLGEWIRAHYPEAIFVTFDNVQEGFQSIEDKEIDFFGINGITALYYINILGFDKAKILTKMDYIFHLKIALHKEIPKEVLNRIDEALADIPAKERNDIYRKWTSIKVQKELDWKLLITIIAIALLILLIFWLINRHLKKLVNQKTKALRQLNESLEQKVQTRTQALAKINKHMQDSITYASLIQNSILPPQEQMQQFFQTHFIIWEPKDIVGGDIYFFHEIEPHKALLYVIDCTGHGVSGAFVSMLAKAIEAQVATDTSLLDSPSKILTYFNRTLKHLLKQEQTHANVGMDAGVVLIDKSCCRLTFAGANIPLFYEENGHIKTIAKNRYSIGYKECDSDYHYREYTLNYTASMRFYLSTDGYIDQNGGTKGFPMGRKRFYHSLLKSVSDDPATQRQILLESLQAYQGDEERNDDITLIGFTLSPPPR
jgi:serine phosphatase RsbU (regulator of sigma subunit)